MENNQLPSVSRSRIVSWFLEPHTIAGWTDGPIDQLQTLGSETCHQTHPTSVAKREK